MQFPEYPQLTEYELKFVKVLPEHSLTRKAIENYNKIFIEYSHLKTQILKKSKPGLVKRIKNVMQEMQPLLKIISLYRNKILTGLGESQSESINIIEEQLRLSKKIIVDKAHKYFETYLQAATEIEKIGCILMLEYIQKNAKKKLKDIKSCDLSSTITTEIEEIEKTLSDIIEIAAKDPNYLNRNKYTDDEVEVILKYIHFPSPEYRLEMEKIKLRGWDSTSEISPDEMKPTSAAAAAAKGKSARKKGKKQSLKATGGGGATLKKSEDVEQGVGNKVNTTKPSADSAVLIERKMQEAVQNAIEVLKGNKEKDPRVGGGGGEGGGGAAISSQSHKARKGGGAKEDDLERGPITQERVDHLFSKRKSFNIKELRRVSRWDNPNINPDKIRAFDESYQALTDEQTIAQQIKHFGPCLYKILSDAEFRSKFVFEDEDGNLMMNCTMTLKDGPVMEGKLLFGLNHTGDAVMHRAFIRRNRNERIEDFLRRENQEVAVADGAAEEDSGEDFTFVGPTAITVELRGRDLVVTYPNHRLVSELKIRNLS